MSRTYHHFNTYDLSLEKIEKGELFPYYWTNYYRFDKAPKWFRKVKKHKPRRSALKKALHINFMYIESDDVIYPLSKKPVCYYW